MSDIANVGYSFKLPQGVEDDDAFWDVLENRRNLMTDWPESRVKTDSFTSNKHQKWNGKGGGHFINDDVAAFDAPLLLRNGERSFCDGSDAALDAGRYLPRFRRTE
ncbi:hypothetical protein DER46DRAFT_652475 [Fusarium sp. MPI-SDFR-AT-0072]|nr:hypothetical protein DER46DRAFT_652475 [Fusarium sp. MPI-SDFR-AT-0072]